LGQIKQERVREKVKIECARVIQTKLNDPRAGFITVQNVELSRDFRNANIYVSVLGSEADKRKVMRMLVQATGYIQREVAGTLRTRVTPALKFVLDTSVDKSFRVAAILDQIKKENPGSLDPPKAPESAEDGEPDAKPAKKPKKPKKSSDDDDSGDDEWGKGDDDDE
jgi:ribosome-binding factor A